MMRRNWDDMRSFRQSPESAASMMDCSLGTARRMLRENEQAANIRNARSNELAKNLSQCVEGSRSVDIGSEIMEIRGVIEAGRPVTDRQRNMALRGMPPGWCNPFETAGARA